MSGQDDARLTDVELKLMDLERTVETLNEVVLEQAARIEDLTRRLEVALEREAGVAEGIEPFDPEADRPPHF